MDGLLGSCGESAILLPMLPRSASLFGFLLSLPPEDFWLSTKRAPPSHVVTLEGLTQHRVEPGWKVCARRDSGGAQVSLVLPNRS